MKKLKVEIQAIYEQQSKQLESIAALNREEARDLLFKKLEEEYQCEIVDG